MIKKLRNKVLLGGLIIILFNQAVNSQTNRQGTYLSIDQLTDQLQQKYSVEFFYKPEWFEMKSFLSTILNLPFEEVLEKIENETDLSIVTVDSVLYIFVPLKSTPKPATELKRTDELIVGNPDDYGKYSKATVQGKILDGQNGNPLPGASVFIDKLKLGVTADKNGNYHFKVPVGEYTIRLTFMGYDENTQKINLVSNGYLDLKLYEKSIHLG